MARVNDNFVWGMFVLKYGGETRNSQVKAEGGKQIKKNKIALLKKEFDLFDSLKEKIKSHDLELQKQSKMSSSSHHQNVGLYYKGNLPSVKADSSPKTAFSGEKMKETQTTSSSYNSGYHSSSKASSEESEEILFIPRSGEYYSNVAKDKTYVKRLDKIIRDAMTTKLRKRNEERMKKNIENLVDDLKKAAEEVNVEEVKVEKVKDEAEKQIEEAKEKKESSIEVKVESSTDVVDVADKKQQKEADQNQTEVVTNTEVPITEVLNKTKDYENESWSSLTQREEEAAGPCVG
ncbi:uncharacterized protein LOC110874020 [Helianthus annuus]|uniref:uncharacterized protein LOC110874020 n=1 Tax=Helianthus annuus TaxID=4232 RepID=UPI000B905220|nr:uncharacterized protein LOC110874020 [Helianthus annuus]